MKDILIAAFTFLLSIGPFILGIRSLREKGYLFNNSYIFASEQERAKTNKTPLYRQSGIVFLLCGIILLLTAVQALLITKWLTYIIVIMLVATLVYAVISGIVIEKKK